MRRPIILCLLIVLAHGACQARAFNDSEKQPAKTKTSPCVILLHGLGRTAMSMSVLARELETRHYRVTNLSYPSTDAPIEILTRDHLAPAVQQCQDDGCKILHMVAHSLGGIMIRQYLQTHSLPEGSRIVMLSPPNQGSEIADELKSSRLFHWITGPAGQQLGTTPDSVPNQLAPVGATIGVITGNKSWNPLFSYWIPGPDDGKVAVSHARLEEMADFLVVPASHTFIMEDEEVIAQTIHFLQYGRFNHEPEDGSTDPQKDAPASHK